MSKTTQKELKNGVRIGIYKPFDEVARCYEIIRASFGVYGMNGALLRDTATGDLYAITSRNSALFKHR